MNRLLTKNGALTLFGAVLCLILPRAALYAGSSLNISADGFAAGTKESLELTGSTLTLIKAWGGGTQAAIPARWQLGFAFDETRNKALVFGGQDSQGADLNDTWLFDAAGGWTRQNPAGPPAARHGHNLIWIGDKFLMFGGSGVPGNEAWKYSITGDTWTSIPVTEPWPPALDLAAMAYDTDRSEAVLFGGSADTTTWIYDAAASTWTSLVLNPSPPHRRGASMAYDRIHKKMVLFGGENYDGARVMDDTWVFDVAARVWTEENPGGSPEARKQGAMAYDPVNGHVFQYGGLTAASARAGDLWYYNFTGPAWSRHHEALPNEPGGRYGHGLAYDPYGRKALIFGGDNGGTPSPVVNALWTFTFLSTGSWTSGTLDAWQGQASTGPMTWDRLTPVFGLAPDGAGVYFQLASSSDTVTYNSFSGPDGTAGTFYTTAAAQAIWPGHGNRRYLKIKADFFSTDPPGRPELNLITLAYDRAPHIPALVSPADGGRTNDSTPPFTWDKTSDPDLDGPLLYQLQVDADPGFFSPEINEENIAAGTADVSFSTGTILPEGIWYWRVRAKDPAGLYGYWSGAYSVTVDTTTPPLAVSSMTAAYGADINSILLTWTFPGDDKGRVDGGAYIIRFSSQGPVLTGTAWTDAQADERSGVFSAAPGETVQTTVSGLSYATTYYFAVKTRDELGNLSALSSTSPFALTDSSPTITLTAPNGGELILGTTVIAWAQSDANIGDSITKSIFISSDSGAHYSILIASDLAPGATSYSWDSAYLANGSHYRIKVEGTDQRGLSSGDASDSDFALGNTNNPPSVRFSSAPAQGEEVSGSMTVSWEVSDMNSTDTHTYGVYISADSGTGYSLLAGGLTQTSYLLDTKTFANRYTYRLKITAADSGAPRMTGEAVSPVFAIVNSLPPGEFALIKPAADTFPSIFDLKFAWEPAKDPEGGAVTYQLRYSTTAGPAGGTVISGLTATDYTPPLNSLLQDTEYFWTVTAEDQYLKKTSASPGGFIISRLKAKSPDGLLMAEILSGMPPGGYLAFRNAVSSPGSLLEQAGRDAGSNRLIKVLAYPFWEVLLKDAAESVLPSAGAQARISFTCPEAAQAQSLDPALADIEHLKLARLDETAGRWEIPLLQTVVPEKKQVSMSVNGLSVFSVIAAVVPSKALSGITNFPNPFSAGKETTRIRYALTADSSVGIRIYTLLGDLVRVLDCPFATPGCGKGGASGQSNELVWDGKNGAGRIVANGMYLAEITAESAAGRQKEIRRIGVLK
ncbi:MAG: kelch repeat-containing protein [Elusimicrobiales bacterium]|jgi:hypothetical protein